MQDRDIKRQNTSYCTRNNYNHLPILKSYIIQYLKVELVITRWYMHYERYRKERKIINSVI